MHDNRTSSQQYWYIPLPLPLSIAQKGEGDGKRDAMVVRIRIGRPSLHWILFFLGTANLAKAIILNGHVPDSLVPWVYVGCVVVAGLAAKVVVKFAAAERTPRSLTGLLGVVAFGYNAGSMPADSHALPPLSAAGAVLLLTLIGETGYLISRRRHAARLARRQHAPSESTAITPAASGKAPPTPELEAGPSAPRTGRSKKGQRQDSSKGQKT